MVDPLKIFWVLTNSTYLVTKFIRTGTADKNDYPLFFEKALYETDIEESLDVNQIFLTVTAKTNNESSHIRYKIAGGNIGNVFGINNTTGAIYVARALDYEKLKKYELRLTASDSYKENYTTVLINIKDVNDNPPVFEKSSYRTQITEEDDRGLPKRVLKVIASDADVERPINIIYFLTGPGIDHENPSESNFDINKATGEIFVLKPLNRDQPNGRAQWRFTVFAQDEGGEGLVGFTEVQINLKDVNDNAPIFTQGIYHGNVTENGTIGMTVMTIKAEDYDDPNEGTNAKIIYSIEKNAIEEDTGLPIFDIDPDTGVIKTAVCCLDREKTPDYSLQIVATDGGGLKGTGTASIRVKDLNDMPPHFTKDEWFVEVDETDGAKLPELPILTVTVNDDDEVNNFQYKIIESSGYGADKFTMIKNNDGTGSLKVVQPLDYEDPMQINGFRFRIQVNDNIDINDTDKYHIAHSWVIVKLKDINDNTPRFKKPYIEANVFENAIVGHTLGVFKAIDIDNGGKSKITYTINRNTDRHRQFSISQDGVIAIQRELDRETIAVHHLEILAVDDGVPKRTATASLTVNVRDINDNGPEFAENYQPVLMENSGPMKIIEIRAIDKDDNAIRNGGPFTFRMSPDADNFIRTSFRVDPVYKDGTHGAAIVSSLRSFDREQRKEYQIPIEIKDSGITPQIAVRMLTVTIGDVNDNVMQPGSKEVVVYNYQGQSPDTPVGRVFVNDLDDWDLNDKRFYWSEQENPRFKLDEETGMITMRRGAREGKYRLRFRVYDHKHLQEVTSNMTIFVKHISYESILNSGSIRMKGITDEEFIRVWHTRTQEVFKSKLDTFKDMLADLLDLDIKNIDVFSVQLKQSEPDSLTDVRFSANTNFFYKSVRLNGLVQLHREQIQRDLGVEITMVNIDECLSENNNCNGSCTTVLDIDAMPYLVNANRTSLVGVKINANAECSCRAKNFTRLDTCRLYPCFNGGRCTETKQGVLCQCPHGYTGPRCQQTVRTFRGNGWAWYPPLDMCENSHLSFEFVTRKSDGLLLYNGPITPPSRDQVTISDFIAIELDTGYPRLLIDFGSGTLELKVITKVPLDNGEWHRLDVSWDYENIKMVVDFCKTAEIAESEDGLAEFNDTTCQVKGKIPPFNEYLNLNTPLQLGGLFREKFDYTMNQWQYMPIGAGFDGCIRNLQHNSKIYDLSHPGLTKNSLPGCLYTDEICNLHEQIHKCLEHGNCIASFNEAKCECHPGWSGPMCNIPTIPTTFRPQSYVKYALSFEPDRFHTEIQLRFRTREITGELFRISDQHSREYGILEIKNANLYFRYSLNSVQIEEHVISLSLITIDDGVWHQLKIRRYGSAVIMELDGSEGNNYNQSLNYEGHQWLSIDKQEGVFAGGKPEYTGVKTFDVSADYQKSCLDDIRLDGKHLPLPPATNGTQWGQATMAKNIDRFCSSNNPCINAYCPEPFECVDLWNKYECTCGDGLIISSEGKGCVDRNECLDFPCLNGGTCINQEPRVRYRCICPEGFYGENCGLIHERQALKFSTSALAAVIACLLIIIILLFVYFSCSRRKTSNLKKPVTKDDIRENIINYCDEGGGENDMTAFDMKTLKIPIGQLPELVQHKATATRPDIAVVSDQVVKVDIFIDDKKRRADLDINSYPFDDLRNYAYEGCGSTSGSLSSLQSGTDDEPHEYNFLTTWGPRFDKLVKIYEPKQQQEQIEDDAIS